jgi:hypothetical protein
VLDPARGAISGVGPPPVVELVVVVVRAGVYEVVLEAGGLEAGGLGGETVRTARIAEDEVDERLAAALAGRVGVWTTRAFAFVACFADLRARRAEFWADGLLAEGTAPASFATAVGASRGKP